MPRAHLPREAGRMRTMAAALVGQHVAIAFDFAAAAAAGIDTPLEAHVARGSSRTASRNSRRACRFSRRRRVGCRRKPTRPLGASVVRGWEEALPVVHRGPEARIRRGPAAHDNCRGGGAQVVALQSITNVDNKSGARFLRGHDAPFLRTAPIDRIAL